MTNLPPTTPGLTEPLSMNGEHPTKDEPTDPYDLGRLRFEEAEYTHGDVGSKKVITTIPVRKPRNNSEWFQVHPGREYQLPVAIYERENDESVKPETYLVLPQFSHLFGAGLTPVRLRLAVNSLGTSFLWPMKMPKDGRMSNHLIVLQEIVDEAERQWVKIEWDNGSRAYNYHFAPGDLGDPQFPSGMTMRDLIALGFKGDRLIASEDHPVIAEYLGKTV